MQLTEIQGMGNIRFLRQLTQLAERHKKPKGSKVLDVEIKSRLHTGRQNKEMLKGR